MTRDGTWQQNLLKRTRFELLCASVLCGAFWWTGCSVERNYELLSFFFDGVPNPNALPVLAASGDPATMRASVNYSAHTPYLEGECSACHGQGFTMRGIDVGVCLDCHADVPDQHRYMHGPVAVGACLICHVPHESAYRHLLKSDSRTVCAQCHAPEMLSVEAVPEHRDPEISCMRCHTGHGDDARYMLRDEPLDDPEGLPGRDRDGEVADPDLGEASASRSAPEKAANGFSSFDRNTEALSESGR